MVTDDELIQRVAQGHDDAAEDLYKRYAAPVFTLALQILKSREEAEEVLQDTFLKLYQEASRFDAERAPLKTFIYAVARNQALSRLRVRKRAPVTADYDIGGATSFAAPPETDALSRIVIQDALSHLTQQERTLLGASFYEGLSHEQLAARYNLPLGTLKSKLRRALLKLHDLLEPA